MTILGFTDEITTCDCCGRTELKGTYVMDNNEGAIFYYGSSCGVKAANFNDSKELRNELAKTLFVAKYENAKGDTSKIKMMTSALKKGLYTRDEFFLNFGSFDHSSKFESFYSIGSEVHSIPL